MDQKIFWVGVILVTRSCYCKSDILNSEIKRKKKDSATILPWSYQSLYRLSRYVPLLKIENVSHLKYENKGGEVKIAHLWIFSLTTGFIMNKFTYSMYMYTGIVYHTCLLILYIVSKVTSIHVIVTIVV